jgi:hypothetical protein
MGGEQLGGNAAGGRRARIMQILAARRQGGQGGAAGQGGGPGGRFGQGGGRWQGGGGGGWQGGGGRQGGGFGGGGRFGQGAGQQGPLAGGGMGQRFGGGGLGRRGGGQGGGTNAGLSSDEIASEREALMQRVARLEKLLENTYKQLEELDALEPSPEGEVLEVQADEVEDVAPENTSTKAADQDQVKGKE